MLQSSSYPLSSGEAAALPELAAAALGHPRFRAADPAELTDDEWDEAIELLAVAFNGGPGWFEAAVEPVEHLRWKLTGFPGSTRAYLSGRDAQLLGFIATLARTWLVRGVPLHATDIVDAALHPSVQRRALMEPVKALRREVSTWDATSFAFGFASHPSSLRNRAFQGRLDLGPELTTYLKPLDLLKYIRTTRRQPVVGPSRTRVKIEEELRRTSKPTIARLAAWQARLVRHRIGLAPLTFERRTSFEVSTLERFDDRSDAFFERAAEAFEFIQVRNRDFLNWRYADPRAGAFEIRAATSGDELLGYAVVRTDRSAVDIADLLVLPGHLDVAHGLLRDAIGRAREAGATALRSWMLRGHPYEPLLADLGFLRVRTSTVPVFHENPGTPPETVAFLADPDARVHLMLGDSDHV